MVAGGALRGDRLCPIAGSWPETTGWPCDPGVVVEVDGRARPLADARATRRGSLRQFRQAWSDSRSVSGGCRLPARHGVGRRGLLPLPRTDMSEVARYDHQASVRRVREGSFRRALLHEGAAQALLRGQVRV